MTGNDDGQAITRARPRDRTGCARISESGRDIAIRARVSRWNLTQQCPDLLLESRPLDVERHVRLAAAPADVRDDLRHPFAMQVLVPSNFGVRKVAL